jgi:glycosyltransferase involved in cell wall biosynthesis
MERLSWEFLRALSRFAEVKILANRHGRRGLPLYFLRALPSLPRLWRWCEVVHLSDPVLLPLAVLGEKISRTRRPLAMHVHGLDLTYANPLYQAMLRQWLGRIDLILPISRHVRELLNNFHLPSSKVAVLNPAVEDRWYLPSFPPRLPRFLPSLPSSARKLLFVGRLVPRKGLLWFCSHVLPRLPSNFHLLVVGRGPEEKQLKKLAQKNPRLHLLGSLHDNHLRLCYRLADVFVMPNLPLRGDVEGFGLVALEAASCGVPVVASRVDGIPDAVHTPHTGLLVPPRNAPAFAQAVQQAADWEKGRRAQIRRYILQNFRWEDRARKFCRLTRALYTAATYPSLKANV